MTRAVRDRILKDANGNINDHLRSHIHLTNCIHLKNHMHKQSPALNDRSLMRDLVALQRSRSLKDPSMSPPSWQSQRGERDARISNGRRSIDFDGLRDGKGILGKSPTVASGDGPRNSIGGAEVSGRSNRSGVRERRRGKREVGEARDRINQEQERLREEDQLRILSEHFKKLPIDSDDGASSHNHVHGSHTRNHRLAEEAEASVRSQRGGLNRGRRRKFRAARRPRVSGVAAQNEMSVASNSSAHEAKQQKYRMEEGDDEYADQNFANGCGVPWNWSRIHHRGKSFLDIAGRSLSCGLSDSRITRGKNIPNMPEMSDLSGSSTKSDAEALPLLRDASGSVGSSENVAWVHDYSGELGIFADNLLKHEIDSDLMSEARSGEQHNLQGNRHGRHESLTQKYMPRTFRDLVGLHLVAQALSNAVAKRKIGLLYVFYGPHGTGKTSTARIFSRALNCQSREHPKPCGNCNSCVAHDQGKSRNIREIGPVSNFDYKNLLGNMNVPQLPSRYKVYIFDDCDTLSHDCWNAIVKVIDRAPRHVVFILVCSSLEVIPHIIISSCQKFLFPKLKDADIIYALQWIATKEDLEIDKDALKLIASKSDGSLRDAEMILEQLSLLGQRVSVPLVQEMVGLIADEKLVDLLDFALSADTVNTVKNLREIMESGVEPLALMSQLATVITDILASGNKFIKEGHRRKFFRQKALSKEDMEKLRQALRTLSEAEKQLRMSNDRLTWLTATLLQLAPDQQYVLPSSSAETSFNPSPLGLYGTGGAHERPRKSNVERSVRPNSERGLSERVRIDSEAATSSDAYYKAKMNDRSIDRPHQSDGDKVSSRELLPGTYHGEIKEIWLHVLKQIRINNIREFLYREGKLISVSYGAAPTVRLAFSSHVSTSTAERFNKHILQAFEAVLRSPVTIEISSASRTDVKEEPIMLPMASYDDIGKLPELDYSEKGKSEIVEIESSPRGKVQNHSSTASLRDRRKAGESNPSLSIVRGKVSLAHILQQAEGSTLQRGWSKRKAISIAEKLEQENLRLESRSRSFLCWKASKRSSRKNSHWRIRTTKPRRLLRFVACGKCLSGRSTR